MSPTALVTVTLLGLYLHAAHLRRSVGRRWSPWRTASFVAGTILVVAATSPPLADWARHDMRAHMAQHLALGMYAPIALVMAAPVTLALTTVDVPRRRALRRVLASPGARLASHPITAAVLDVGGLFVLYLTPLLAITMSHRGAEALLHAHLVGAGSLFAWSIAGPDPSSHRAPFRTRVVALVVASGAHALLAKRIYAEAGSLAGSMGHGTAADVEAAAEWMYYGGDVAEIILAIALFGAWYRRRCRQPVRPARADSDQSSPALSSSTSTSMFAS